jgi:futalosine hydrolase
LDRNYPGFGWYAMELIITSATPFEIAPLQQWLQEHFEPQKDGSFAKGDLSIHCLITGVGMVKTAFHLATFFAQSRPDLVINAGIAGTYVDRFPIGSVVHVVADRFGDLGVEEADGDFTDVHQMDLIPANEFPFQNGWLLNPDAAEYDFLPQATCITVNKVHGTQQSIYNITEKYQPEIESMEGAAFAYACLATQVKFLQIRSISNIVEPRNRANWNLPLAIDNLNEVLIGMVRSLMIK